MLKRDIKVNGIILKKVPFRETSIILEVFTDELGKISVIAKGIRKEKDKNTGLTEILNELELVLYKNPNSELYILKSANLMKAHLFDSNFKCNILMNAAVEIYRQLIIQNEDSGKMYELLSKYLEYIKEIEVNGIAIFWRFLLRVFVLLGIDFNITNCMICHKKQNLFAYYPHKHGFICNECYKPAFDNFLLKMSNEQSELLSNLNHIGKLLKEIELSKTTISQVNKIFLTHLSEHFHQKFHLKSLELYENK